MSKGNLCVPQAREADIRRRMDLRDLEGRKNREIAYLLETVDALRNALTAHLKAEALLEPPK